MRMPILSSRTKSFRNRLFSTYSTLILIILLAAASLSYVYFRGYIQTQIASEQNQMSISVANATDMEIDKMNTVSMNIFYSSLVRNQFERYIQLSNANALG